MATEQRFRPVPSTGSSRRGFLAACGTAALAGCSALNARKADEPPAINCDPATYDWSMYGFDAARTSALASRELPDVDAEVHRLSHTGTSPSSGGSADGPPAVDDGTVYVAGDLRVEAIDAKSRKRMWAFEDYDDPISTSPALACGMLYVSALNETFALDPADGTLLWRADVGSHGEPHNSPAIHDGTVYVSGGGVTALDAETGKRRWRARTERSAQGVAVTDRVYVGTGSNASGAVEAFTLSEGERWWRATEVRQVYSAPAVANGTVYAASKDGMLTALAAVDGSVRWRKSIEDGVYEPPAVAGGRVYVCAGNGEHAYAFDAATGERLWQFETGLSQSAPVVLGETVLLTSANDGVYAANAETGEQTWYSGDLGIVDSQPVVAGGRLYFVQGTRSDVYVYG